MAIALGVDVGTTAVKCALVDTATRTPLASAYETTSGYVERGVGRAEQRVDVILRAVRDALATLPQDKLRAISSVGICGQMHGIVWWKAADAARVAETVLAQGVEAGDPAAWSRLVTWEDQRCSATFLEKCSTRIDAAHAPSGAVASPSSALSSGYGLATYAHTLETEPESLSGFDTCGTIHDLLAFVLCGHTRTDDATIDTTDACSWGGFDLDAKTWNGTTVTALGIPTTMLPQVKSPGTVIGHTTASSAFGLPAQVPVFVPMGDHPCSVLAATAQQESNASSASPVSLVNVGTSAQLAMILPRDATRDLLLAPSRGFEIRPFLTDKQVLGVAAALSGGNIFAWLVQRCQQWITELSDDPSPHPPSDEATAAMYERLIRLGLEHLDTELVFCPTLNGERATPDASGHIGSLQLHNGSLGDLSASLCRGLVQNLVAMVPDDLQRHFHMSRVIGTGAALVRNALLQRFLARELMDAAHLHLQDAADAAVGAALAPVTLNLS